MSSLMYWVALSHIRSIGFASLRKVLKHFATLEELFAASEEALERAGLTEKQASEIKSFDLAQAEKSLAWCNQNQCNLITWDDIRYPWRLRQIYQPPLSLYVRGNLDLLHSHQLAIVGSRKPSRVGYETAKMFGKELTAAGLVVTSGLATGIDAASHWGALSVGATVAVMGTGLAKLYPKSNQLLFDEILLKGALVSEYPPHAPALAQHFPQRNRIISGLSLGVLVIEAALKSGSLITAKLALDQNREVFAMPGSIYHQLAKGCHALIQEGAKLTGSVQDIIDELGKYLPARIIKEKCKKQEKLDLDPHLKPVLAEIGYELTSFDDIILRSGLTTGEVSSILLSLELKGYIESFAGGYIKIPHKLKGNYVRNLDVFI